jgi:hypothetical protein
LIHFRASARKRCTAAQFDVNAISSARMSDQHDPFEPEVFHDGNDVLSKRRDRELPSVLSRLAVAREVETDNAVTRRQMIGLLVPNMAVATPTVHENQRRFPIPMQVVADRHSVF